MLINSFSSPPRFSLKIGPGEKPVSFYSHRKGLHDYMPYKSANRARLSTELSGSRSFMLPMIGKLGGPGIGIAMLR